MQKSVFHGFIVPMGFMLISVSLQGTEIPKERGDDEKPVNECLKSGDILLAINGTQVSNPADSVAAFKLLNVKGEKTVKVFCDNKEVTLKCKSD